jgi:hypothetical protein
MALLMLHGKNGLALDKFIVFKRHHTSNQLL